MNQMSRNYLESWEFSEQVIRDFEMDDRMSTIRQMKTIHTLQLDLSLKYGDRYTVYSSVGSADGVDLHDIDGNYLETFDSVADARHKLGLLPFAN